jgi:hypothetical protein
MVGGQVLLSTVGVVMVQDVTGWRIEYVEFHQDEVEDVVSVVEALVVLEIGGPRPTQ